MRTRNLLLLSCMTALLADPLRAADGNDAVPEWVVAGIAAVETGSDYHAGHLIRYRDRRDGAAGEVGPWQLSPAVLADLHALAEQDRVRSDPAFSERLVRKWLLRCRRAAQGDWDAAIAVYHTGPGGSRRLGKEYAARVRAAGMDAVGQLVADR